MKTLEQFKNELNKSEHWDKVFSKLISKQGLSDNDKNELKLAYIMNRDDIIEKVLTSEYKWSTPRKVEIAKNGKKEKRVVYVYSIVDRLVLGVLQQATSSLYDSEMSNCCFSYRSNKSTGNAINFLKRNKGINNLIGCKIDIHSYFNSVSRGRVVEVLNEWFPCEIRKTLESYMLNDVVTFHDRKINEFKGLVPGTALASFFANVTLIDIDRHFESLNITYARYSDDIIVFGNSRDEVQEYLNYILDSITKYGLTINPEKYSWFESTDCVQFLGAKINKDGSVDISDHAKMKIKRQIHRWCKKGRARMELDGVPFEAVAKGVIRRINGKNMFCLIDNEESFGWCQYAFKFITTTESLTELDFYIRDSIKALKTGKHNKANVKALSDEDLHNLGWVSLYEMYKLYKKDFDYYCEVVELMKDLGNI